MGLAGLTDSHAHLDGDEFAADLDAVVARARAAGVVRVIAVGLWRAPGSFGNALDLAARMPDLFAATVGIHPHECARVPEEDWARHDALARDPRIVAVGETGLDFHYDHSPRPVQEASFRRSLAAARAAGKPAVIHVREADDVCARVLREEGVPPAGGVIHCFTGDAAAARAYLDLGLFVSVAGVVTFKTAEGAGSLQVAPWSAEKLSCGLPFVRASIHSRPSSNSTIMCSSNSQSGNLTLPRSVQLFP